MNRPHTAPTDTALRSALQGLAADISQRHTPPPASAVWLRAQRRTRQRDIARATLPLRIMSLIGLLTTLAATAFAIHNAPAKLATDVNSSLDWAAPALALILLGCLFLLRLDRTGNQPTSS